MHKKCAMGIVYSTNPNYDYQTENQEEELKTLAPEKQNLSIGIDRRQRAGKQVTVVSGFIGKSDALEQLGKVLKTKCGVGGAVKEGVILIQGDFRDKAVMLLRGLGYQAKRSN